MTNKIEIKLHPNSSKEKIEKLSKSKYEIWVKEKPIGNKANIKIVKLLKKFFKAQDVKILSGFTGRKKRVEIID
jgi:uncharacterized protein (TIGR00251 family)